MIKIIVDSTCNLTKLEAEKLGFYYLPYNIIINNKLWQDGVNIKSEKVAEAIINDYQFSTSTTPIFYAEELLKKASAFYNIVFVITASSKVSSQFRNMKVISEKLKNVYVIDSCGNGNTILAIANIILNNKYKSVEKILEIINYNKNFCTTFLLSNDKSTLKKSGRFKNIDNNDGYLIYKNENGTFKKINVEGTIDNLITEFLKNDLSMFDSIVLSEFNFNLKPVVTKLKTKTKLPIVISNNYSSTLAAHNGLGSLRIESGNFKK